MCYEEVDLQRVNFSFWKLWMWAMCNDALGIGGSGGMWKALCVGHTQYVLESST